MVERVALEPGWTILRYPITSRQHRGFTFRGHGERGDHSRVQTLVPPQPEGSSVLQAGAIYAARPLATGLPERQRCQFRAQQDREHDRVPPICDKREWLGAQDCEESSIRLVDTGQGRPGEAEEQSSVSIRWPLKGVHR